MRGSKMNDYNNQIKLNQTSFKGAINMNKVTPLEDTIKMYIEKLYKNLTEFPQNPKDFSHVFETFQNTDKSLSATNFMLSVSAPPKSVAGHELTRNLEVAAYKLPIPYKAERIIATGTMEEILKVLKSDKISLEIKEALKSLSKNLEDV